MKNNPLISVVTVSYNAVLTIEQTILSVINQTYPHIEYIIIDGGSTDGTVDIIKKYANRIAYWVSEPDKGIYDAMNQAVKLAKGEYFLFLNTGDSLYDNKVLEQITDVIYKRGDVDIIYGNMYHKALDTVICASPEINDFTCYRNVPCHQTCFYRRTLFESRGYRTEYTVRADYEHFLWCYYDRKAAISYVPVVVASYEGGGYSETKENQKRSRQQHREIVLRYMGKKKADRYRLIMVLTLAPLRSAVADNRYLSGAYNGMKTALYKLRNGRG